MGAWGKIAVVLLLAFISNQVQCLISCAAHPDPAAVHNPASCHHKEKGGSSGETAPCPQQIAGAPISASHLQVAGTPSGPVIPLGAKATLAGAAWRGEMRHSNPSPPGSTLVVLRI